jgi:hypothetical protein
MPSHASHAADFPDAVLPGAGRDGLFEVAVPWVAVVLTLVTVAEVMGHGQ